MNFLDEVSVTVSAGRGGNGCLSFLRRANIAKGGPNGGNGGAGGSVYLIGDASLTTLIDLHYKPLQKASNGAPGGSSLKRGADGQSLTIHVPVGTTVFDDETLRVIGDVTSPNMRLKVASGGMPGRGNASFKTSTNRSPRQTTLGTAGEQRRLRLQLRVLADVGLLGMPNAGKSTFLSVVSASKPQIAEFPFTTLTPHLGVVRAHSDQSFVIADVPGLIRGASKGVGLGTRFMRHLTRTSILLHLVEVKPSDESDPYANATDIEKELATYSQTLADTTIYTVLTKIDCISKAELTEIRSVFTQQRSDRVVFAISSHSGEGVDELLDTLATEIHRRRESATSSTETFLAVQERSEQLATDVLAHSLAARRQQALAQTEIPDLCEVEVVKKSES